MMMFLADGAAVPTRCVRALEGLELTWPGATHPQARAAIVQAVLKANETPETEAEVQAVQIIREQPDVAFMVNQETGDLYARTPEDGVIMFTGEFREKTGEEIRNFLVAHFSSEENRRSGR